MDSFSILIEKLTDSPKPGMKISVKGKQLKLKAIAKYYSTNYPNNEYIKIMFSEGAFMLLMLADKEIYYADKFLELAEGISDEMIGNEHLTYAGKEYQLVNKDDYQFVKRLYVGDNTLIEGECRFSDYFPVDQNLKEFFSLGWLSVDGKRADIWSEKIELNDIEIQY